MIVLEALLVLAMLVLGPMIVFGLPWLLWDLYREHRSREHARRDWTKPGNLRRLVRLGMVTTQRDRHGDAPLHLAYYFGYQDTIDQLIEDGADENAVNSEGLLPAQLSEVGRAARDLRRLAGSLDDRGNWSESELARSRFEAALELPEDVYLPAQRRLLRDWSPGDEGTQLAILAWKLGRLPEKELVHYFQLNFDVPLANYFLRCGSPLLAQTAKNEAKWRKHPMTYTTTPQHPVPRGRF